MNELARSLALRVGSVLATLVLVAASASLGMSLAVVFPLTASLEGAVVGALAGIAAGALLARKLAPAQRLLAAMLVFSVDVLVINAFRANMSVTVTTGHMVDSETASEKPSLALDNTARSAVSRHSSAG